MSIEINAPPRPRRRYLLSMAWRAAVVMILIGSLIGCERMPQMTSGETMHLLTALRTACSVRSDEHLEAVRQKVDESHQAGRLSDADHDKISEIIETAAAGDWEAAEQACFRFQKANSG